MSCESQAKAVDAAATRRRIKRGRSDLPLESLAKRPRTETTSFLPFRFLDLPAELRNRIYEIAFNETNLRFPTSTFHKEQQRKRLAYARLIGVKRGIIGGLQTPIPYTGLVQSCAQIRSEFRLCWMKAHRIPLCNLDKYVRTFYPTRMNKEKARDETEYKLRVFLHEDEMNHRDLLLLLKHKLQYPNLRVKFEHLTSVNEDEARGLEQFVNNDHPQLLRWIRRNVISQVRLEHGGEDLLSYAHTKIILVVKEKFAAAWMKTQLGPGPGCYGSRHEINTYLGLESLESWNIEYAVDYS